MKNYKVGEHDLVVKILDIILIINFFFSGIRRTTSYQSWSKRSCIVSPPSWDSWPALLSDAEKNKSHHAQQTQSSCDLRTCVFYVTSNFWKWVFVNTFFNLCTYSPKNYENYIFFMLYIMGFPSLSCVFRCAWWVFFYQLSCVLGFSMKC